MMSPYMLMGALMQQSADAQRRRRRRMVVGVLLLALGGAGLAASGWVIARATVYAWQTSDWNRLQDAEFFPMPFFFFFMGAVFLMILAPARVPAGVAFLQTVATDGAFASPAAPQPAALTAEEPDAHEVEHFNSLRPLISLGESRSDGVLIFIFPALVQFANTLIRVPDALGLQFA